MESLPTCISARSDTTVLDESVTIDTDAFSESCEDLVALQTNEPIDTTVADESVTVMLFQNAVRILLYRLVNPLTEVGNISLIVANTLSYIDVVLQYYRFTSQP